MNVSIDVSAVVIPFAIRKELAPVIKRVSAIVPGLHVVDADIPLSDICKDDQRLEQVVLGREYHISLGRTVPIRVHQIESIVLMLRQKLQSQKGLILFSCFLHFLGCAQVTVLHIMFSFVLPNCFLFVSSFDEPDI